MQAAAPAIGSVLAGLAHLQKRPASSDHKCVVHRLLCGAELSYLSCHRYVLAALFTARAVPYAGDPIKRH